MGMVMEAEATVLDRIEAQRTLSPDHVMNPEAKRWWVGAAQQNARRRRGSWRTVTVVRLAWCEVARDSGLDIDP
jgi:hypothetical protein